jgi:RNA polymerase sigma factor (sigma-70 family)
MGESGSNPSRLEAISTRWSVLRQAHEGTATTAGEARQTLVLRYSPAVRRYVGALLRNDEEADDLAQDVVLRLLSGDFAGADPQRGRFRDLLKVAARNMVRNHWQRQKRRRPAELDVATLGAAEEHDDGPWLSAWRRSVLDLAWNDLKQEERDRPGSIAYTVLRLRADHPDDSSEELAARLSKKVGKPLRTDAVRQQLRRARVRFADLLIAEIGHGLKDATPEKIEEELVALGLLELVRDFLPAEWHQ